MDYAARTRKADGLTAKECYFCGMFKSSTGTVKQKLGTNRPELALAEASAYQNRSELIWKFIANDARNWLDRTICKSLFPIPWELGLGG